MQLPIGVFLLLTALTPLAGATGELRGPQVSLRGLGMGGAYVAVVDTVDALYYNPGALARIGSANWLIADPRLGLGNLDTLSTLADLQGGGNLATILDGLYGEPTWAGAGARSAIGTTYLAAGLLYDYYVNMEVRNPPFPEIDLTYLNDQVYSVGLGFPVIPGVLFAGGTIKAVRRVGTSQVFSGSTLGSLDTSAITAAIEQGSIGYGFDFGMNLSIPSPMVSPTFAMVWQNVGGMAFKAKDSTARIPNERDNVTLGAALDFNLPVISFTPAIEIRHLTDSDSPITKKLHLGIEVGMPVIDLRAGFYQGYYSLGVGLGLGPAQLELATWGVELGEYPGQLEDRRYALQVVFEIDVGTGISLFGGESSGQKSGGGAGRKRQKQRR
jgi:hypothetical protein